MNESSNSHNINIIFFLLDGNFPKMKRHNGFNTLNLFVDIIGEIEKTVMVKSLNQKRLPELKTKSF